RADPGGAPRYRPARAREPAAASARPRLGEPRRDAARDVLSPSPAAAGTDVNETAVKTEPCRREGDARVAEATELRNPYRPRRVSAQAGISRIGCNFRHDLLPGNAEHEQPLVGVQGGKVLVAATLDKLQRPDLAREHRVELE